MQQGQQAGIGLENLSTHAISWIRHLPNTSVQVTGTWDGTTAVWIQYSNPQYNDFSVWSWTPGTTPRLLGRSDPAAGQAGYTAPIDWPALSGSYAAWIRAIGPGGLTQLIEANLVNGQTRIVAQGHLSDPVYYDGLLIWGQALHPRAMNVARAADPKTGEPRKPPAAVAAEKGGYVFTTSGNAIAFLARGPSGAGGVAYYSASPNQTARPVFTIRGVGAGLNALIQLDGSLISATGFNQRGAPGDWIISGSRRSSYFIPQAGAVIANASDLFFIPERIPSGRRGIQHPLGNIATIRAASAPVPTRCP